MTTNKDIHLPFFAKAALFVVGIFAFFAFLYIAQGIIVPLVFALIIAIVLHPVVQFFVRIKINRVVGIVIALLLTVILIAGVGFLIVSQASRLSESWPMLMDRFTDVINQTTFWLSGFLDINPHKISDWMAATKGEILDTSSIAIGQTIVTVGGWLIVLFLVPVYVFMILYYEPLLIDFIHRLSGVSNQTQVGEIVTQIKSVIQHYLVGLIIETGMVSALNVGALLILGIDYAILIGVIGGLLNVIPYVGGIIAVALPMMVALATKSSAWYALYVLAAYYAIQLFDNNYIVPIIVASKVKINALFSVIVVIVGNALWGISGMFLSIPILAIVKLIFDRVDHLKPWGYLLGDTMPSRKK